MSITFGPLRFLDSCQFMSASLEQLAVNLMLKGDEKYKFFINMRREFSEQLDLLCKKGHYPYEWVDDESKLDHVGLPPREVWGSELTGWTPNDQEWAHINTVWTTMNCYYFRDYHDIYLKTDCLLLADVFQRFREVCHSYYGLDPANYYSCPGLAWDAMLLKTKIKLQLINDTEMLSMIERMKRGGLCFVGSKRHVEANNPHCDNYDPAKPTTYLMYWDANNLYGWPMTEPLPFEGLRWNNGITLEDILATDDHALEGHMVKVDLHFPSEIHDKLKEFPPAPENITPELEWFSEFQKELGKKTGNIKDNEKYNASSKLIPHLFDHIEYVIHYRNLKFLVDLGVQVTKLHKVITFNQKPWLKDYIDFNSEKRAEATNKFEKDFFKLMNNAVFGKTMENVKNRVDIRLATSEESAVKQFSKMTYKHSDYFDGVYIVEHHKTKVVYDKPLYVGTSVLDLSKLCMMNFYYGVIQKHFPNKHKKVYADTDSGVYLLEHPDIYAWMKENKEHFDLSETVRPDIQDNSNKMVIGKQKDELKGHILTEITALNPKVYSFNHQAYDENNQIVVKTEKKCKGVSKAVVKKDITHDDYLYVLKTGESLSKTVVGFASDNHEIHTTKMKKKALTSWYDKMKMLDEINCVPFGYHEGSH